MELARLDGVPLCDERLVLISEADHPPVYSALDVEGRLVFTFRQGCFYQMRLEAWFAHDHATTWLMWRKGMVGANLNAWIEQQQAVYPSAAIQAQVFA